MEVPPDESFDLLLTILRTDVLASHLIVMEELRSIQKRPLNPEHETRRYLDRRKSAYETLHLDRKETLDRIQARMSCGLQVLRRGVREKSLHRDLTLLGNDQAHPVPLALAGEHHKDIFAGYAGFISY